MSRGAKGLFFGGGLLFALWVFVLVLLALTGPAPAGSDTAGPPSAPPSDSAPSATPAPGRTVQEPTTTTSGAGPEETAGPASRPGSDPFGTPADAPHNEARQARRTAEPSTEAETGPGQSSREPGRANARPSGANASQGDVPRQDIPQDDPAKGAGAGVDLSDVETSRAEAAAFNFISYAYGYSGRTREQYEAYVNQAVVPETFRESPGAAAVEDFAANVGSDAGVESTLAEQSIELSPHSKTSARAETSFVLEDPSGTRAFAQDLEVKALGPIWKVAEAGPLEPAAREGGEEQ